MRTRQGRKGARAHLALVELCLIVFIIFIIICLAFGRDQQQQQAIADGIESSGSSKQ